MMINPKNTLALLAISGLLWSCGSEPKQASEEQTPVEEVNEERSVADLAQADQMVKDMPSPIEMAILVKHAGGEYNAGLLNDVKRIDDYITTGKKTVNMGVYSADVGYTSLYKQTQETVFYLNNVRKLSDAIGLTDAFDQTVFDRVEANIENRDSLLHILSGAYDVANDYLKENDRMNTSVLMIAGGWIESMYLAANLGADGGRPEDIISLRILEQEKVLEKLLSVMRLVDGDPLVDEFEGKLSELDRVLVADQIRIGEGEDASVNAEKMEAVYVLIDEIRAWAVA
ncbi:MAG: hypothetical protein H6603_01405 [Flavobacteriales bacterium]|nr:hypothetical protein [Flavobacteriales bacterium]MCB9203607.1 hypothetical protein [Flavobacteriales bacterium]